jgi:DNA adenine methylase
MHPIIPFLRWAGSKRQILKTLAEYWSIDYRRYIEPFAGSASLFFYIGPSSAILGDINSELILTYGQVRDNLDEVLAALSRMRQGRDEYYRIRSLDYHTLSSSQRAARFIYLNRFAFNGLYRTNQKGQFNVPYGGKKTGKLPGRDQLKPCSTALSIASLVEGDFEVCLSHVRTGDFVYLDPPYKVEERRVFSEYDPTTFQMNDLIRLREWLDRLSGSGATFLLSYAQCEEAKLLMDGYHAKPVKVRRNIAGFSGSRKISGEWLISNKEIASEQES